MYHKLNCGSRRVRTLTAFLGGMLFLPLLTIQAFASESTAAKGILGSGIALCYGIIALCACLIFIGYLALEKKPEPKFLLLYAAVFVVDCGYFLRGIAGTLQFAMAVNALSYLGAAFSVLLMLLIVIDTCGLRCSKKVTAALIAVTTAVFLLAASGTFGGLYYVSAELKEVNGISVLVKEYGPLHILYPVYLLGYFLSMVAVIVYAAYRKTIVSTRFAIFLAVVVFGNILVWFVEQRMEIDFEFLSVSYIATALLLLLMRSMQRDYEARLCADKPHESTPLPSDMEEVFDSFVERAQTLSPAERRILRFYIDGHDIADIPELAYISINTVKKHNRNIYQKLEVHSRDELILYIDLFRRCGRLDELVSDEDIY